MTTHQWGFYLSCPYPGLNCTQIGLTKSLAGRLILLRGIESPASTANQKDSHSIVVVVILPVSDSIPDGARVSGPVSVSTIT